LQEPGSAGMDVRSTLECIWLRPRTVARKSSKRGFYVCAGGLDISNFNERYTDLCVSYYNLGGL